MKMQKENKENIDKVSNIYDELVKKLSTELLKLHQEYINALEGEWCEEIDFYYVQGFKLGLLIGIECTEE